MLNDFYAEVVELRHDSVVSSANTVECLLKFGLNHLTVDYYFSILTLAQTFSVNREDVQTAMQMETLMDQYLALTKNKA